MVNSELWREHRWKESTYILHIQEKKIMWQLHQDLQTIGVYDNEKENMDDFILLQRVPILFQKVNYGENISI